MVNYGNDAHGVLVLCQWAEAGLLFARVTCDEVGNVAVFDARA